MAWHKKLFKASATQAAISRLLKWYIKLVFLTSRVTRLIDPAAEPYMRGDDNGVFMFWHGRMMMMLAFCPPRRRMYVLSTPHRDGQISSRTVRLFGNYTIYGSSRQGGSAALREMIRVLKEGHNVTLTPEAQRGPAQVMQPGTLAVARLSGKPLLPVAFSSTRHVRFKSWDRLMLALPFGHIVFCVGAPIGVDREADEEAARLAAEQAMNALVEQADAMTHA